MTVLPVCAGRFIPVLSRECVGVLEETQPYIIGINSYLLEAIPPPPSGGCMFVA